MIKLQGKYDQPAKFHMVRAQRALLRSFIRQLAFWEPIDSPEAGYSIIIGCNARLSRMLGGNLRMLAEQNLEDLQDLIVVFDRPQSDKDRSFEHELRTRYPQLPLRFLYYTPFQARGAALVGWAWVYSWLSWCIGIAAVKTRYALLHDFDAMLIRPDILRIRYERMKRDPVEYVGVRHYSCNGVLETDRLVTTFELMFDSAFVRERFRPIDLFNHVCTWRGRTVDFDTFLHAQTRAGRTAIEPIADDEMVHPSQMICQFTEFMNGRELNPTRSSLLLIPYFLHVAGDQDMMRSIERQLHRNGASTVRFFGKPLRVGRVELVHAKWLEALASRLERSLYGSVRPEVQSYFEAVCSHAEQDCAVTAREAAAPA